MSLQARVASLRGSEGRRDFNLQQISRLHSGENHLCILLSQPSLPARPTTAAQNSLGAQIAAGKLSFLSASSDTKLLCRQMISLSRL